MENLNNLEMYGLLGVYFTIIGYALKRTRDSIRKERELEKAIVVENIDKYFERILKNELNNSKPIMDIYAQYALSN